MTVAVWMVLWLVSLIALASLPLAHGWSAQPPKPKRVLQLRASSQPRPVIRAPRMLTVAGMDPSELASNVRHSFEAALSTVVYERGRLRIYDPDLAAFVGGAVGVIGTVESIMARRRAVRERLTCVYCDGAGTLGCGICFGTGRVPNGMPCDNCAGSGKVSCVSCQGSGNSVLLAEDRNLIRELAGLGTMQDELEQEIDDE
eukprot:CAMPEP_0206048036 /NCGR_PEP_ID=MMETSP1466-20131121/23011_1 /ASSEMBLY_ACC=CAM_ASM_001126 /TAXON_ID=44452 /ORGANISM="Pavlova gyrans, Strain CCMP608" /LENGTH=200 /DNA_ID=CAMNT_0053423071 /DNA_START=57 /DNA_END=657 /DNA_ORIENTATION=+